MVKAVIIIQGRVTEVILPGLPLNPTWLLPAFLNFTNNQGQGSCGQQDQ
jgi:hypothetical protein